MGGGLGSLLNNPNILGMAAQMMQNPAFQNLYVPKICLVLPSSPASPFLCRLLFSPVVPSVLV